MLAAGSWLYAVALSRAYRGQIADLTSALSRSWAAQQDALELSESRIARLFELEASTLASELAAVERERAAIETDALDQLAAMQYAQRAADAAHYDAYVEEVVTAACHECGLDRIGFHRGMDLTTTGKLNDVLFLARQKLLAGGTPTYPGIVADDVIRILAGRALGGETR